MRQREWRVSTEAALDETVSADYLCVEGGTLFFRNNRVGHNYPELVRVFAAGFWKRVEKLTG